MTTTATQNFDKTVGTLKVSKTLHAANIKLAGEWKSFTPVLVDHTANASATKRWRYRIIGTTLHVKGYYSHSASGAETGNTSYKWTLPTGCSATAGMTSCALGDAFILGATNSFQGVVLCISATTVAVKVPIAATTTGYWGLTAATPADTNMSVNAALSYTLDFTVELDPTCAALANLEP